MLPPIKLIYLQNSNSYAIVLRSLFCERNTEEGKTIKQLLDNAVTEFKNHDAKMLFLRFIESGNSDHLVNILKELGFRYLSTRVEVKGKLSDIPGDVNTPIIWKSLTENYDSLLEVAIDVLVRVYQSDMEDMNKEITKEQVASRLSLNNLMENDECVDVGFDDKGIPFAIMISSVVPESKLSTIPYMGIVAEYKGKKLGDWVFRHGIAMMRKLGGEQYYDGTLKNNAPMVRIFAKNNLSIFQTMQEWCLP